MINIRTGHYSSRQLCFVFCGFCLAFLNKNVAHSFVATNSASTSATATATVTTRASRIQTIRRTDRGAGKNRRTFQPLGLLRPDSVACVYDFNFNAGCGKCGDGNEEEKRGNREHGFRCLASDGNQTLRSLRRNNPGNVFLSLDEPFDVAHMANNNGHDHRREEDSNDNDVPDPVMTIPIVATDDVFLRQRIVQEGGYVMTFHQLWLLLMDI
mmetsp:Transcript_14611/g.31108  ORF Transcript_14611/g.31108 Transcript_14611/m.31108 type:complete len:212 (+) Transcript_14611:94-729(+)